MQYSNVWALYHDIYPKLEKLTNCNRLLFDLDLHNILEEIKDVYTGYPEQTINTVVRVTVLTYTIHWNKLSSKKDQSISQRKLELMGNLIAASVYHLTASGNTTDSTSYEIYKSRWEVDETIEFLLRACSLNYDEAFHELKIFNYPESIHSDVWELYCTLKEALALAYCKTDFEYQEFKHLFQDATDTDALIDLAKTMLQPGWFKYD